MWTGQGTILGQGLFSLDTLSNISNIKSIFTIIVIILIFLRIMGIIWTAKDIATRTNSILLQVISIILVTIFTPILGLPLYKVIRPVSYKKDKIPRREACATGLIACYNCHTLNPREYICCINCGEHLKIKCKECGSDYPHTYQYCNVCGAPNLDIEK